MVSKKQPEFSLPRRRKLVLSLLLQPLQLSPLTLNFSLIRLDLLLLLLVDIFLTLELIAN